MLGSSHADYHVHVDNATPYGLWPLRGLRDLAVISFMSFCCWVTCCLGSHFRLEPSSSVFLLTRYEWREDLGCQSSALHASLIFFFIESSNTRQLDTKRCLCVRSFPFVSSTYMGCLSTLQGENAFDFILSYTIEVSLQVSFPLATIFLLSLWRLH